MKGWYQDTVNRAPPPDGVTLERIMAEWVDLYSYVPPPGENIHVSVEPFSVDYLVPTEEDIEWAVTQLRYHRSGGLSGMRSEYLKGWLAQSRMKEREEAAAYQETLTEGTPEGSGGTGGEGTDKIREKTPEEASNWERVVDLVQTAFEEGQLVEDNTWQAVVLTPKGENDYCGIGLVEVM